MSDALLRADGLIFRWMGSEPSREPGPTREPWSERERPPVLAEVRP